MTTTNISQWRTVIVSAAGATLLTAAFSVILCRAGSPVDLDKADRIYSTLMEGVVWLVGFVAAKAGVEHLGRLGGLRGARGALLDPTPDAPEDPKSPDKGARK